MEWYALALISALFSAFAAILEKKILFKQHPISFTFILSLFNLALASLFLSAVDISAIPINALLVLLLKSALNALAFLMVMYAIKNLELSECLPLLVLTPGFIAIFGFIFLGEALTLAQIAGLCLLIAGIYILGLEDKQKLFSPFKKLVQIKAYRYIFIALALFTTTSLLDRFILVKQKLVPEAFMFYQHLFFAAIFLLIFLFSKDKLVNFRKNIKLSWFMIISLAVFTIIYRYTEILAVKAAPATALAIVLKRLSVFFAVIIGGKLFHEGHLLRKAIATAILIAGAVLVV
ncbi:MAG: EamA family transporter [archaeon]|jgi:transporter family protein|nr:EamA family transporter [archaeon]